MLQGGRNEERRITEYCLLVSGAGKSELRDSREVKDGNPRICFPSPDASKLGSKNYEKDREVCIYSRDS
jgi:hypothetical protein